MAEHSSNDARIDRATAQQVDAGLRICSQHGLDPALHFLEQAGVPRLVALRVLCSPDHFRKRERRRFRRPGRHMDAPAGAEMADLQEPVC
ncbi:hypothetical protein [Massilia sp. DD77]|uniref:hypothetical protein n=1 Tax=Massilia sp. DD77 TaxID=3109349 RepID=UPI002FFE09A1